MDFRDHVNNKLSGINTDDPAPHLRPENEDLVRYSRDADLDSRVDQAGESLDPPRSPHFPPTAEGSESEPEATPLVQGISAAPVEPEPEAALPASPEATAESLMELVTPPGADPEPLPVLESSPVANENVVSTTSTVIEPDDFPLDLEKALNQVAVSLPPHVAQLSFTEPGIEVAQLPEMPDLSVFYESERRLDRISHDISERERRG
jgi:hypothetical protein